MKHLKSHPLNEGLSSTNKAKLKVLVDSFMKNHILNEFFNNSDGAASFYNSLESMDDEERGIDLEIIDDNYDEMEKMVKTLAKKLADSIR